MPLVHAPLDVTGLHPRLAFLEKYAPWRNNSPISYGAWRAEVTPPRETRPSVVDFDRMDERERHAAFVGFKPPAQAGLRDIHALRVLPMLAAEFPGREAGKRAEGS